MKATSKFQTNRYANADELIQDLDNVSFVTAIAPDSIFESTTVVEKRNKRKQDLEKDIEEVVEARERDRKKKRRKAIAITTAIILLLAAIGGGYFAWKNGAFSSTKAAPDLLDKTFEEAQAIAEADGFKVKKGNDIYSSEYAEGRICQQDPQPGVEMPKEGTITINVSKGNKEGLVPSVLGMQEEDVEAYLKSYGYELGNVNTVTSPEKEGKVLEQTPVAGSTLDKESKVDIVVSDGKGTEKGTVPSVTRMSLKDAKKAIEAAGFQVGNITYDWDASIGKGYVIYQQYQANSQLDKGTAIDLQVSSGPEPAPEEPAQPEEGEDKDKDNG